MTSRRCFYLALVAVLLFSVNAHSDQFFRNLRNDGTVPEHCRNSNREFFRGQIDTFTIGSRGAEERGFTFEHPISRNGARNLWRFVRGRMTLNQFNQAVSQEPALREYNQIINDWADTMDFDFGSEGEILEILAIHQLWQHYDVREFYITGGITYHANNGRTVGELDLVIGDRDTCQVLEIGEAKLGHRGLGHARRQLRRFLDYKFDLFNRIWNFWKLDVEGLDRAL